MDMKPCKFFITGVDKPMSYDEVRQYLLDNYEIVETSSKQEAKDTIDKVAENLKKLLGVDLDRNVTGMGLDTNAIIDQLANFAKQLIDKGYEKAEAIQHVLQAAKEAKVDVKYADIEAKLEEPKKETKGSEPSFEKAEGEERIGARAYKRKDNPKAVISKKLEEESGKYTSVDMDAVVKIVEDYFADNVLPELNTRPTKDVIDDVVSLAKQLMQESVAQAGTNAAATKSSFANVLLSKLQSHVQFTATNSEIIHLEKVITDLRRDAATILATSNTIVDPMHGMISGELEERKKAMSKKTSSGKTVGEVVDELHEEIDNQRKEAVKEVLEGDVIETTVKIEKEKKATREPKISTVKKTAARKKREAAITKFKSTFNNKGAAGPLMIVSETNIERLEALKDLAQAEISLGYYTFSEVVSRVYEGLGGLVSKRYVADNLKDAWEGELASFAESMKQEEATELIKDAVLNGSNDALLKALAKALKVVSSSYNKSANKGKKLTDAQVVAEILSNPEQAEQLLKTAYGLIEREVLANNAYTDVIKSKKPANYTDEQWESLKAKYVLSKFKALIDNAIGKAKDIAEATEAQRKAKEEQDLRDKWLAAKDKYEQSKDKNLQKQEQKELERIAKKELEDAERELEKAQKEIEADKNAWLKAKDKYERAKEKAKQEYEDKEKKRLAIEELNAIEKEFKEKWAAQDAIDKENKQWIDAKDRRDKAREKLKQRQDAKEIERLQKEAEAQAEQELKEAEQAYSKLRKDAVKKVVKDFYGKPSTNLSLAEALIAEMPSLTFDEALHLAEVVELEMEKKVAQKDNRRIKALVNEMTNGKDEASATRVVAKAMSTRGAMNSYTFSKMLSGFLGYKGVPTVVVNKINALLGLIQTMPNSPLKQQYTRQVNSLVAKYTESNLGYLNEVMNEVLVRNVLSRLTTAFTGGLSAAWLGGPTAARRIVSNPAKGLRALKFIVNNYSKKRYGIRQAMKQTFVEHGIPYGRELASDENPFNTDRAWIRARKEKWNEIFKLWENDKKRFASHAIAKLLIGATFQGKKLGVTNLVNDLQSFIDYTLVVTLRDLEMSIEAQREAIARGVKADNPAFDETWKAMMSATDLQMSAIDAQIDQEIIDMQRNGIPVPKDYIGKRSRQLITENSNKELLKKAHHEAVQGIGMGNPEMYLTAFGNALTKKLTSWAAAKGMASDFTVVQFVSNAILTPLTLFSRITFVLAEKGLRYGLPVASPLINAIPVRFEVKEGEMIPKVVRNEDGSVYFVPTNEPTKYAARLAASSVLTGLAIMALKSLFDFVPLEDENGIKIDEDGNPIMKMVFTGNLFGLKVDFYGGGNEATKEQKGENPTDCMIITHDDGTTTKINFAVMPHLYPFFKGLGTFRDDQRYVQSKVVASLKDGKPYDEYQDPSIFNYYRLVGLMSQQAYNYDFSPIQKIVDIITSDNTKTALIDALLVQNAKSRVNSGVVKQVEEQIADMQGQHKIYVGAKLGWEGGDDMAAYLMEGVWFTDPFIQDRKNYESLDPFGNPIEFPSLYSDFWSMFGSSATWKMAEHIEKNKEDYAVYQDSQGKYNADVLAWPKRYMPTTVTEQVIGDVSIELNEKAQKGVSYEVKREIADNTYRLFGSQIEENRDYIMSIPYEKRGFVLDYLYDNSKAAALLYSIPDAVVSEVKLKKPYDGKEKKRIEELSKIALLKNSKERDSEIEQMIEKVRAKK